MGFRVIGVDESMGWSMPKLNKVIPAEDKAFVMQIHPKSQHSGVHLMGTTLRIQTLIWQKEAYDKLRKYNTLLKIKPVVPDLFGSYPFTKTKQNSA